MSHPLPQVSPFPTDQELWGHGCHSLIPSVCLTSLSPGLPGEAKPPVFMLQAHLKTQLPELTASISPTPPPAPGTSRP